MDKQRREAIRARLAAATPGEWYQGLVGDSDIPYAGCDFTDEVYTDAPSHNPQEAIIECLNPADAALAVYARNADLRDLLEALEQAEADVNEARERAMERHRTAIKVAKERNVMAEIARDLIRIAERHPDQEATAVLEKARAIVPAPPPQYRPDDSELVAILAEIEQWEATQRAIRNAKAAPAASPPPVPLAAQALRMTAAALQYYCAAGHSAREAHVLKIDGEARSVAEILDLAATALQEQEQRAAQ